MWNQLKNYVFGELCKFYILYIKHIYFSTVSEKVKITVLKFTTTKSRYTMFRKSLCFVQSQYIWFIRYNCGKTITTDLLYCIYLQKSSSVLGTEPGEGGRTAGTLWTGRTGSTLLVHRQCLKIPCRPIVAHIVPRIKPSQCLLWINNM